MLVEVLSERVRQVDDVALRVLDVLLDTHAAHAHVVEARGCRAAVHRERREAGVERRLQVVVWRRDDAEVIELGPGAVAGRLGEGRCCHGQGQQGRRGGDDGASHGESPQVCSVTV
jgi:hypothetical protein